MRTNTLAKNLDHYIIRSAFIYSAILNALMWLLEEETYSFDFLWTSEFFAFAFLTTAFAALMIGVYYSLKAFRLEPAVQLFLGLFVGGLPVMYLIYLSLEF